MSTLFWILLKQMMVERCIYFTNIFCSCLLLFPVHTRPWPVITWNHLNSSSGYLNLQLMCHSVIVFLFMNRKFPGTESLAWEFIVRVWFLTHTWNMIACQMENVQLLKAIDVYCNDSRTRSKSRLIKYTSFLFLFSVWVSCLCFLRFPNNCMKKLYRTQKSMMSLLLITLTIL